MEKGTELDIKDWNSNTDKGERTDIQNGSWVLLDNGNRIVDITSFQDKIEICGRNLSIDQAKGLIGFLRSKFIEIVNYSEGK